MIVLEMVFYSINQQKIKCKENYFHPYHQTMKNISGKSFFLKKHFLRKIIFWKNNFFPCQTHPKSVRCH